ncbi:MAG: flagellar motility protein MotE (MotC chaperone) [Candidatus Midichloriaceae bacterium]|jgi:flagellar motility protein MotE (MotC chaperone)
MLRLLPYALILLVVMFFSKLMNVLDEYLNMMTVQESQANLEKPSQKESVAADPVKNDDNTPVAIKKDEKDTGFLEKLEKFDYKLESEKKLLQQLRKRRKEIDEYKDDIYTDRDAMVSIKQHIDSRLNVLEKLQQKIKPRVQEVNKEEVLRRDKLVKVYESMKSKDAAKIFDELPMGILLDVTETMKESKLALILADMKADKARELTTILSDKHINFSSYSD